MSEINSQFFNGKTYSATDFVESNKNIVTDGILPNTEYFRVAPASNMTIGVTSGRGWVQGHSFNMSSTLALTLEQADGKLDRVDTVIIRLDLTTDVEKIECKVIKGTLGAGATVPVRNGTYYDLVIAQISVAHGTTVITSGMITDTRALNSVCGICATKFTDINLNDFMQHQQDLFNSWFGHLNNELNSNQAGNLQNQIDNVKNGVTKTNSKSLQGIPISEAVPTAGQGLKFDGTSYVPEVNYVIGTYTGDGTASRTISLGFTPKAIFVFDVAILSSRVGGQIGLATTYNPSYNMGGTAYLNIEIVTGGIKVYYSASNVTWLNAPNDKYNYIAFK